MITAEYKIRNEIIFAIPFCCTASFSRASFVLKQLSTSKASFEKVFVQIKQGLLDKMTMVKAGAFSLSNL